MARHGIQEEAPPRVPEARARSRVCVCVHCVRAVRASDLEKGTRNAAQHSAAPGRRWQERGNWQTGRSSICARRPFWTSGVPNGQWMWRGGRTGTRISIIGSQHVGAAQHCT